MAFNTAIGKKTTVSKPAAGTIKKTSPATSAIGIVASKQSRAEDDSIDRIDSAPPAEIISIADFNRIYETGASKGKTGKTAYGLYYDALRSVHSITTEDVAYVISKALQNDVGGQWESLRASTERDIENAKDFVNDLSRFLNTLERSENSLDFGRSIDEKLTTIAREFLSNRLRSYEKRPEDRNFDPKFILGSDFENDSNSDILKKMLAILREALTLEEEKSYKDFIAGVSQKRENDLNAPDAKLSWEYIDGLPETAADRLAACAELISHVLSISTGIPRVQDEPISSKIAFKASRISSIFDGTEIKAIPGRSVGPAPLPFKKTLNKVGPPSSTIALSLLQFDARDGKPVVPVEVDDPPKAASYRSGPTALIRKPILEGEFTFSDLQSFSDKFEESRSDIESYLGLMIGQADPYNALTPIEVFRVIVRNFAEGLDYSTQSFDSMLQLLAMKSSVGGLSMGRDDVAVSHPRQHILRSAAKVKFYQLKSADLTSADSKEGGASQTITTTRVSENSASILSSAKVSTSLTTSLSSGSGKSKLGKRVISRLASDSPPDEEMASSMYDRIVLRSNRNAMSKQDINNKISEKTKELRNLKDKLETAEREVIAAVGLTVYATLLTGGLAALVGGGATVNNAIKKVNFYKGKVESAEEEIDDLKELLRDAVTFLSKDAALISLKEAQKKTSGNFFSQITKAYNEIVSLAESRLPPDELMTSEDGTTRYGNLDEFGLMSLVVECFIQLSLLAPISSEVDSRRNINPVRPSKGAVKSLKSDLITLISNDDESELGSVECDVGEPARLAALKLLSKQQRVQDTLAYFAAFSRVLNESADELVSSTNDLLNDVRRRQVINTVSGRQLIESLTSQQIIYRRSLLERYIPRQEAGYIPARIAYSQQEDLALDNLLSSPVFADRTSENKRIVTFAIPTGTVNSEKRYVERDMGEVNRSGMFEVVVGRKDHELDDLLFKEKIFLFDPQLFVSPDCFSDFSSQKGSSDPDAALSIAKRIKFLLCDRDSSSLLSYNDLKSNPRYSSLSSKQFDEIVRNTTLSYLMETYTFKLCGMLADEIISLEIDDSTSQAGIAALVSLAGLNLPDLVLPTAAQINASFGSDGEVDISKFVDGMTTGDKELLAGLTSSFLMRNDTLTDRVLLRSKFDRVMSVVIDPDDFEIDRAESVKQNGAAARAMLQSLAKQGMIIQSGSSIKLRPRDPLSGGFSIGSVYCQFMPHTVSSEPGTLLRMSKQSLGARLSRSNSVGLTSKKMTSKATTKKSTKSITNTNKMKKSPR